MGTVSGGPDIHVGLILQQQHKMIQPETWRGIMLGKRLLKAVGLISWEEICLCVFVKLPLISKIVMNTKARWSKTAFGHPSWIRAKCQTTQTHRGTARCCGSSCVHCQHWDKHRVLWKCSPSSPHPSSHGLVILSYIVLCLPDTWKRISVASLHLHA